MEKSCHSFCAYLAPQWTIENDERILCRIKGCWNRGHTDCKLQRYTTNLHETSTLIDHEITWQSDQYVYVNYLCEDHVAEMKYNRFLHYMWPWRAILAHNQWLNHDIVNEIWWKFMMIETQD